MKTQYIQLLLAAFFCQSVFAQNSDLTAPQVIEKYIEAVGGRQKLESIKDITMIMETNVDGQLWQITNKIKSPNKQITLVEVEGELMEKSVFDGETLINIRGGQKLPASVAETREAYYDAFVLPEMHYQRLKVRTTLMGIEKVNQEDAYKIEVLFPNGIQKTDYYSVATGLKVRSIQPEITQQGNADMIWDYKDYKSVEGVLFPFVHFIPPAPGVPQRLTGYVTRIELNAGLKDREFKLN